MSAPQDWLKAHQTATVEDLSNDIWVRVERTNRKLEKLGRGDFTANMPSLFAMYYCTALSIMRIPEDPTGLELQRMYLENLRALEDECLIEPDERKRMEREFHETCRAIAEAGQRERANGETVNPFSPVIKETARRLGLPYGDVHLEFAADLADFAVSYRTSPQKKSPFSS